MTMADARLTSKQVKCAKCVNCINNHFRLLMDNPKKYDEYHVFCVHCYVDRLRAQCDLALAKLFAMQNVGWLYKDRYSKTYLSDGRVEDTYIRNHLERARIMQEWRRKITSITAMTNIKEIEAVGKAAQDEYFGKKDGNDGNDGKGAAGGR